MISEYLCQAELETLLGELGQVHAREFENVSRSILVKKVSPDHQRSVFRVFDVLNVAREVAEEERLEGSPAPQAESARGPASES